MVKNLWRSVAVAALVLTVMCAVGAMADDEEDFYEVLQLTAEREDATERQIKSNWRRLSREFHPDLKGEESREMYKKIQRAYEVLSDRKKRKIYDMKGEEGLKQLEKSNAQQGQPQDPMMQMFGFGGQNPGDAQRGQNVEMVMLITLEDAYSGTAHNVRLNKQRLCKQCRGTGAASKEDFVVCTKCKGTGQTMQRIQLAPGFVQQVQQPCPKCGGKGKQIKKKCPTCKGKKVSRVQQTLQVEIEQGTPENHRIVFDMEADQSPDVIPGDVIFTVQTKEHRRFKRNGNDLETKETLTLSQALLGFEKTMAHLDDHDVSLSESGVTQFGTRRKIKDEGMPLHNVPSERGNLFVTYEFELPKTLTAEQRERIAKVFK